MTHQMKLKFVAACLCLLATATTVAAQEKWSRQVDVGDASSETDSLDWIPLAQPADAKSQERQGRVLTYAPQQQQFPPAQQKLSYYNSQVQPQQSQFDFGPFQYSRFGNLPQTQPLRQGGLRQQQEPTSQSFFKFEMPFHGDGGRPLGGGAGAGPTLQTGYQISHGFGGQSSGAQSSLFSAPLFNQQPLFPPEFHPLPQKPLQQRLQHQKPLTQQNFIDDIFPLKSSLKETKPLPTQQSLRNVSPQVFPVDPQPESVFDLSKPNSFQLQSPYQATASPAGQQQQQQPQQQQQQQPGTAGQQQEVQLLYVPYETLFNQQQHQQRQPQPQAQPATAQQQNSQYEVNKFNFNAGLPAVNPYQINQFYTQDPLASNYYTTSSTLRPTTTSTTQATSIKQNIFDSFVSSLTTPKPKPKAHQPPLAMFILRSSARTTQADVVAALRQASTIAVIDAPTQQTPDIFVGPAGMPIPHGFVKFDLPYLSQLAHTRDLNDVPFFVAPLSYRTPNGFNKILLPEPHVGSIVVNRAKDTQYEAQQQSTAAAPTYDVTTPRTRTTTSKRIKQHPNVKDYYVDPFEVTTQRATLAPTRGNKFSYYYANEGIQEVTSPKQQLPKQDRPKKKRPQTVKIEEDPAHKSALNNLYAQFNPIPNQITNEDYFRVQSPQPQPQTRPTTTSTSTSTSTTTTTTTSTPTPPALFTYNTSPQVDFKGTHGQLYHDFGKPEPVEQEYVPRFTTRPPPSTTLDDEYRMKQYFRQQDAFRNRPQVPQPTNSPYEQIQDFERQTTTQRPSTTTKERAPIYIQQIQNENNNQLPANHRPAYQNQNEISDANVEYEPNPYQLPSELPQLAPNLPGLVNNLQEEKDKQNAIEQSQPTTQAYETEQPTRQPTRRPINRVRKPVVSKVTSSVSYSESESEVSRRPATRIRRPYGSRGSASTAASDNEGSTTTTTTTRRPSSGRNNLLRNPNRIRYQPTPEERQSFRLKPKKRYGGSKKNENEDLEYQRDVLNQNYPVIKPLSSRKPTSPTAIPSSYAITTTETPAAETQQVYTVTPSNHLDRDNEFPVGLLAQMDIAQQYNEYSKDNYGPGYFPNQEDLNPTEPVIRNEIFTTQPPATTTTTPAPTTTEEPQTTTTRRSPFVRRTYPRLRTTTEAPATTTEATEQRASTRPRIPPRKVIKVRQRTRRPLHPASTTNVPEEETNDAEQPRNSNYRKYSRYTQQENNENENPAPQPQRRRFKPQVQLEGQESQWSPAKTADSTNFKPVEPKESRGYNKHRFEDEPEIVTAGAEPETYEFNVGANYGPSTTRTTLQEPNLKPEKSFAELLEEVMGKTTDETTTATQTTSGTYFESQKTTIANRIKERRGKWRKANQKGTQESFETAESQNIGAQLANSLYAQNKDTEAVDSARSLKATTPSSSNDYTTITQPMTTTIVAPSEYDATTQASRHDTTTTKAYETTADTTESPVPTTTASSLDEATSRMDSESDNAQPGDDLESQPSLFFEVKRQLHELFAIEESEDQAVTAALAAVGRRRQEYTNIRRTKPESPVTPAMDAVVSTTEANSSDGKQEFHKDLMKNVVYATSQTATKSETPAETEICYRGRCIRSEDLPANHKLH